MGSVKEMTHRRESTAPLLLINYRQTSDKFRVIWGQGREMAHLLLAFPHFPSFLNPLLQFFANFIQDIGFFPQGEADGFVMDDTLVHAHDDFKVG